MDKKLFKIIIISVIVILIAAISLFIFTSKDKKTTLTILEKQWIENNKNKVNDLGILNNVPVFNYNGEGLFFDFINSFEDNIKLNFNEIAYDNSKDITTAYSFKIAEEVTDKDILIYRDHFALVSNQNIKYNSLSEIKDITVAVIGTDLEKVNLYLSDANVTLKTFDNASDALDAVANKSSGVSAAIVPININLEQIISNNLYISYHLTEMNQNYVLTLGEVSQLNIILKKYYQKWANENYETAYNKYLANNYFTYNNIDEQTKVNFRSKRYIYGFINYLPYNMEKDNRLIGINNDILKGFSQLSNAEISYKKYDNLKELVKDFNSNNVDFYYNNATTTKYKMDVYKTTQMFDNSGVILVNYNNNINVNSLKSLLTSEVLVVKDSKVSEVLTNNGIKVKSFDTISSLINNMKSNDIVAMDTIAYNYYSKIDLDNFMVSFTFSLDNNAAFVSRDIEENVVFNNFLNFYISMTDMNQHVRNIFSDLLQPQTNKSMLQLLVNIGAYTALMVVALIEVRKLIHFKEKKKAPVISKADKLKYIDILTSLKNRNYLNDNIEKWDSSEIYPQTIIIVDLNNVAYINDNYGHEEGDNTIKDAANILINNQLENSEIIRTSGNEFLIYLVGQDEKQIVTYIRKLNREFKELEHGFGAAIGYSVINDAIKTIDDAINEATLDMRTNKEATN